MGNAAPFEREFNSDMHFDRPPWMACPRADLSVLAGILPTARGSLMT